MTEVYLRQNTRDSQGALAEEYSDPEESMMSRGSAIENKQDSSNQLDSLQDQSSQLQQSQHSDLKGRNSNKIGSLTQLLGGKSPKQFASDYVFFTTGGKKTKRMTPYSSEKQNSRLKVTIDTSKENIQPSRPSASRNITKGTITIQSERKSTRRELTDINVNQMNEFDGRVGVLKTTKIDINLLSKMNDFPTEESHRTPVGQSKFTELSHRIFKEMEVRSSDRFPRSRDSNEFILLSHRKIKLMEEGKQSERKLNPAEISRRLYEEKFEMENNNKMLEERYREEKMKECTFKPAILKTDSTDEYSVSINPNDFYQNQIKKQKEVEEKKNLLLLEKENKLASDILIQPELNKVFKNGFENEEKNDFYYLKKTQQLAKQKYEKLGASPRVHDRLYEIKQTKQLGKEIELNQPQRRCETEVCDDEHCYLSDDYYSKEHHPRNSIQKIKSKEVFSPKINARSKNMVRREQIDNLLYKDAVRRKEKTEEILKKKYFANIKVVSGKSAKAYIVKFLREYQIALLSVLNDLSLSFQEDLYTQPLTYLMTGELLKRMNFLRREKTPEAQLSQSSHANYDPDVILLQKIWHNLAREEGFTIMSRNLVVFLLAVLNMDTNESQIPQLTEKEMNLAKQQSQNLLMTNDKDEITANMQAYYLEERHGKFDRQGNLVLTQKDVSCIHKKFKSLWFNLMSFNKEELQPEEIIFHPQISKNSQVLAVQKKDRLLTEIKEILNTQQNLTMTTEEDFEIDKEKYTVIDLLSFKQAKTDQLLEEKRREKEKKELEQCTFRPTILDYSSAEKPEDKKKKETLRRQEGDEVASDEAETNTGYKLKTVSSSSTQKKGTTSSGIQRSLELFSLAKSNGLRKDKNKDELDYERQCDQCTFQPDISRSKATNASVSQVGLSKGVQKTVERMKNGRMIKSVEKSLRDNGRTSNEKINSNLMSNVIEEEEREMNLYKVARNKIRESSFKMVKPAGDSFLQRSGILTQEKKEATEEEKDIIVSDTSKPTNKVEKNTEIRLFGEDEDKVPLLFVDVNIEDGKNARIIVYEGDKSDELAKKFSKEYNLDENMKKRLKELLDQQINGLLTKIEEETLSETNSNSVSE